MAQLATSELLETLWKRANNDITMTLLLVVCIMGYLPANILLPTALRRAGVIAASAAWTIAALTPLTSASSPGGSAALIELLFRSMVIISSLPVAIASLKCEECRATAGNVR